MTDKQFGPAAEELFNRIMRMMDNTGATDEHRALNYLTMVIPPFIQSVRKRTVF